MARFALALFSVMAFAASANAMTFTEWGMQMGVTAYEAVCWYEKLKVFPNTNSKGYVGGPSQCGGQGLFVQENLLKKDEATQKRSFGKWMTDFNRMKNLGGKYESVCGKYLKDSAMSPPADENDALNDANHESNYPYKGFAYCLMHQLRESHGDEAIEAVKNERTHYDADWYTTLLTRDNEFRARHGSPPLQPTQELTQAAQAWAEKNARECNSDHSSRESRYLKGEQTGESLSASGGKNDSVIAAYLASDGWYEEIGAYPYPGGYTGDGNDALFGEIGHFTQTVWKETKHVGYGFAYNPDCAKGGIGPDPYTMYIVGRYHPAGNMPGDFQKNVSPPH